MLQREHLALTQAIKLASIKHRGQTDLLGRDYFTHHVLDVLEETSRRSMGLMTLTVAALHDIVEDTEVTILEIRNWFGNDVARAVDAITRRPGERYFDYIARCKTHPIARAVKLADNAVNRMGLHELYEVDSAKARGLQDRYERARKILESP